jgi:activator of HSP90 ATPase
MIVGRQVELIPSRRIVQAWRVANWDAGVYSVAKFEISEKGSGSLLIFDHIGFPEGQGEHLDAGWKANYWEPPKKYLA